MVHAKRLLLSAPSGLEQRWRKGNLCKASSSTLCLPQVDLLHHAMSTEGDLCMQILPEGYTIRRPVTGEAGAMKHKHQSGTLPYDETKLQTPATVKNMSRGSLAVAKCSHSTVNRVSPVVLTNWTHHCRAHYVSRIATPKSLRAAHPI